MSKKTIIYTNIEIGKSLGLSRIDNRPIRLVNEDELSTLSPNDFEIIEDSKFRTYLMTLGVDDGFEMGRGEEIEKKEKEKLQQLLDNFYEVCHLCDQCNIGEYDYLYEQMNEMKNWVIENFGSKIK